MTKTIHISFDTETWGKRAGSDARSLGACVFDPNTGYVPKNDDVSLLRGDCFHQAVDNKLMGSYSSTHYTQRDLDKLGYGHRRYYLGRDPTTVDWWHDQSAEAQAAFDDPIDLKEGLVKFTNWLMLVASAHTEGPITFPLQNIKIWSHGKEFDLPIAEAWFHAVNLPVPWFYRTPRDTRTAFDLAGIDNHSKFLSQFSIGVKHHALDDAIVQANGVVEAIGRINSWRELQSEAVS